MASGSVDSRRRELAYILSTLRISSAEEQSKRESTDRRFDEISRPIALLNKQQGFCSCQLERQTRQKMTATPTPSAIAATATVTASPTIMRSNNMARPRVVALPSEMVAMVLSDVEHDRATLMSVMRSNKKIFEHAVRLYWVLVNPQTGSSENFFR